MIACGYGTSKRATNQAGRNRHNIPRMNMDIPAKAHQEA